MPLANKPRRGKCCSVVAPTSLRPNQTGQPYTRYVALHPLRGAAPDQKGCNAYRSGAPPPTTSTTADNSSPQTPTVRIGRCDTASTCSPRLRTRGAAPVTSQNTRYVALHPIRRSVMPTDRVHRRPQQAQPRNVPSRKKPRRLPLGNRRGLALTIQFSRSW